MVSTTDSTQNFILCSNLRSTEEPTASNINVESLCGELYPFIKRLPVRDKQSESFIGIYYKPSQVLREDKDFGNMPHDKSHGKMGRTMDPTSMGISICPRYKSLLNMILMVANFFYYPKKMAQMTLLISHLFY